MKIQEIQETMNLLEILETKIIVQIEKVVNYTPLQKSHDLKWLFTLS